MRNARDHPWFGTKGLNVVLRTTVMSSNLEYDLSKVIAEASNTFLDLASVAFISAALMASCFLNMLWEAL